MNIKHGLMDFSISFTCMTAARIIAVAMIVFWAIFKIITNGMEAIDPEKNIILIILVCITLIAWKWRGAGGLMFLGLALTYIILTWSEFSILNHALTTLPMLTSGSLFIISKYTS